MLEKFEDRIREIKSKTNKKVKVIIVVAIFGIITLLLLNITKMYQIRNQRLEDSYNNAMYQLIDYSKNIEILISKARITTTTKECVITYTDILRQSNLASSTLFLLPVDQNKLQNVAKFFAQVAGYSLSLSNKLLSDEQLSDNDYTNLKSIDEYAINLVKVLQKIYSNLNDGALKWNELSKVADKELSENEMSLQMQNVRKLSDAFTKYEGLIYDGAYSEHKEKASPKMLTGKEISEKEAELKVKKILEYSWGNKKNKKDITYISYSGLTKGEIEIYNFEVMLKGEKEKINVQITKDTGLLYLMMYDRDVTKQKISVTEAEKIGGNYLKNIGIEGIKTTYYTIIQNMITINYATIQNDVIIYPDLIKVKIALDTGEVCSVETKGYIYNHCKRKDVVPQVTKSDARESLNKNLKVSNVRLAIILADDMSEKLVYEFKGQIEKREFLIYINAKTKLEEDVLVVIDKKNGKFTM